MLKEFHYNDKGVDNNGNNGPEPSDPGWIVVHAESYTEALSRLPEMAHWRVISAFVEYVDECGQPDATIEDFIAGTCLWGCGFSLMDDVSWEDFVNE